ncbi:MAG: hypothetical protein KBA33_01060 [Cloacibacterium sp.]|nr:hypothetical protein [Cloacibacterium sp.]
MKSLSLVGIILLLLASILFYFTTDFSVQNINLSHFMGIMGGIGIGLIIGGIVGYMSKGSAIKAEQKRKQMVQLQKEKIELEKQAAELAKQQNTPPSI